MDLQNLTPEEFDAHVAEGTLRLSFVGMSNVGKSYRSKTLHKEKDFLWYCVDQQVAEGLGFKTEGEIATWMGYPSSEGYEERERQYLELEDTYTKQASMETKGKNFVFDTTGSVVHLPQKTLDALRENCLVVHLETGKKSLEEMVENFFLKPKPVAWGEYFTQEPGESSESALQRCYPALLAQRLLRYKKLAHVHVPAAKLRDTSGEETLHIIRGHLK